MHLSGDWNAGGHLVQFAGNRGNKLSKVFKAIKWCWMQMGNLLDFVGLSWAFEWSCWMHSSSTRLFEKYSLSCWYCKEGLKCTCETLNSFPQHSGSVTPGDKLQQAEQDSWKSSPTIQSRSGWGLAEQSYLRVSSSDLSSSFKCCQLWNCKTWWPQRVGYEKSVQLPNVEALTVRNGMPHSC